MHSKKCISYFRMQVHFKILATHTDSMHIFIVCIRILFFFFIFCLLKSTKRHVTAKTFARISYLSTVRFPWRARLPGTLCATGRATTSFPGTHVHVRCVYIRRSCRIRNVAAIAWESSMFPIPSVLCSHRKTDVKPGGSQSTSVRDSFQIQLLRYLLETIKFSLDRVILSLSEKKGRIERERRGGEFESGIDKESERRRRKFITARNR